MVMLRGHDCIFAPRIHVVKPSPLINRSAALFEADPSSMGSCEGRAAGLGAGCLGDGRVDRGIHVAA